MTVGEFGRRYGGFACVIVLFLATGAFQLDNSCSSRPDGQCIRCNSIPECFDLSDEIGCPNSTLNFVPTEDAIDACHGKSCLRGFPEPPPLPPFSLCDGDKRHTTVAPPATTETLRTTTSGHSTPPIPTTPPSSPATKIWPFVTTSTTPPTRKWPYFTTTVAPSTSTTDRWFPTFITRRWPYVTTSTTVVPPRSSTSWWLTTTLPPNPSFMEVWHFCAARYYAMEALRCTERIFECYARRMCQGTKPYTTKTPRPFWDHSANLHPYPYPNHRAPFNPNLPDVLPFPNVVDRSGTQQERTIPTGGTFRPQTAVQRNFAHWQIPPSVSNHQNYPSNYYMNEQTLLMMYLDLWNK